MSFGAPLAFARGDTSDETGDDIFLQPDPRSYFRVMFGLDYGLPDLAAPIFRRLIRHLATLHGRPLKIVDLGCAYGINTALVRHPLDMDQLAHRYRDLDWCELDADRLLELDQRFFASWPSLVDATFIGVDVHADPLAYAKAAGLLDETIVIDLEADTLGGTELDVLAGADLVISTNCADFLSAEAFVELLRRMGPDAPWCAVFALRFSQFYQLAQAAAEVGLCHDKLPGVTFVQRRFATSGEWTKVLLALETMGISALEKETSGLLHSELHLLRPEGAAEATPLTKLVSLSHGQDHPFSGWRGRPWGI